MNKKVAKKRKLNPVLIVQLIMTIALFASFFIFPVLEIEPAYQTTVFHEMSFFYYVRVTDYFEIGLAGIILIALFIFPTITLFLTFKDKNLTRFASMYPASLCIAFAIGIYWYLQEHIGYNITDPGIHAKFGIEPQVAIGLTFLLFLSCIWNYYKNRNEAGNKKLRQKIIKNQKKIA